MANISETQFRQNGGYRRSQYIQLYPGLNLGRGVFVMRPTGVNLAIGGKWQSAYTYATRGIYRLKSRVTLGRVTPQVIFSTAFPFVA